MPAKETLYGLSDNYPADGAGGIWRVFLFEAHKYLKAWCEADHIRGFDQAFRIFGFKTGQRFFKKFFGDADVLCDFVPVAAAGFKCGK